MKHEGDKDKEGQGQKKKKLIIIITTIIIIIIIISFLSVVVIIIINVSSAKIPRSKLWQARPVPFFDKRESLKQVQSAINSKVQLEPKEPGTGTPVKCYLI